MVILLSLTVLVGNICNGLGIGIFIRDRLLGKLTDVRETREKKSQTDLS